MSYKGELLFEGTKFKSYFKQDLIIEQTFLEYDEIPLLCACLDEEGNRYFCNCTEFRTYEKWAIYPVSILQLLKMVKMKLLRLILLMLPQLYMSLQSIGKTRVKSSKKDSI